MLIFLFGCSASSGPSLKGRLLSESKISVQSESISINNKTIENGETLQSKSGIHEIEFDGEVIQQVEVEPNTDKIKHKDRKNRELRCLILMPFCIVAKLGGGYSHPEYEEITLDCNVNVKLNAEPGNTYRVITLQNDVDMPTLIIERITSPTKTIAKKEMDCSELEATT